MSPLHSRGSPTPSVGSTITRGPQQRVTKSEVIASPLPSRGPKGGRKCYVTPAFSGVPNAKRREKIRSGHLASLGYTHAETNNFFCIFFWSVTPVIRVTLEKNFIFSYIFLSTYVTLHTAEGSFWYLVSINSYPMPLLSSYRDCKWQ